MENTAGGIVICIEDEGFGWLMEGVRLDAGDY
jgi:hypothetical protein